MSGQRVEIPCYYDLWMRGDRFGTLVKVVGDVAHVKMEITRKVAKVDANHLKYL